MPILLKRIDIPAVKGVEIGDGFCLCPSKGSEHRDEMDRTQGFIQSCRWRVRISTGQDIVVSVAFKPTSSITMPGKIDNHGQETMITTKGSS